MRMNRCCEVIVEFLRNVPRQFEVLLLVFPDWHVRCSINENVCGHEVGVDVKPDRSVLPVLTGLFLELRHPIEPADTRDAIEHPGEFGVFVDLALVVDDVFFVVDAAVKERSGDLAFGQGQFALVLPDRDGVHVDDTVDAVIAILQRDELGDRAEIIAEMQVAARLDTRKYAFLERHHPPSSIARGAMPRRRRAAQDPYARERISEAISRSFATPSACSTAP